MSADQVADLRERLARIEEARPTLISILERHTSELAQWTSQDQQQGGHPREGVAHH
jgi:hypothetical protein